MKTSRMLKLALLTSVFLAFVAAQAYFVRPKAAPIQAPAQAIESSMRQQQISQPIEIEVKTMQPTQTEAVLAPSRDDEATTSLDQNAEQAMAAQGLATLERIRSLPEAAPLVDEIVSFLQNNPYGEISLESLPTNEAGLVEVNEDTMRHMIRNDEIRAKWQKLMGLVAQYPDLVASIQQHETVTSQD